MFIVEDEVFLKALDESPRFRSDYVNEKIVKSGDFVKKICEQYNLDLIENVYFKHVHVETYNSKKRTRLKEQEILLIKKLKIFDSLKKHMGAALIEITEIDVCYTNYFKKNFHEVTDHEFSYQIIFNLINEYFNEYEARSKK